MNRTIPLLLLAAALILAGVLLLNNGTALPSLNNETAPPTAPETSAARGASTSVVVLKVADGDTFTGRTKTGKRVRVRLLGIDAPEVSHDGQPADCGAKAASTALTRLIKGKTVQLVEDPMADSEDRFQRLLRYLEVDGTDVGLLLVERGLVGAWYPASEPAPSRYASYVAAQQRARAERTGQWDHCSSLGR